MHIEKPVMQGKRILNLDLFRGLAIMAVVFFHVTQMYAGDEVNAYFYKWGKFGVELFFVLSGFLVGGLYYRQKGKVNLFRFWFLRIFRTYPPYLIALIVSFLTVYIARGEKFSFEYLIFVQNFFYTIPYFKISWSLCVEEHFYMAFPFFIIFLKIFKIKLRGQLIFWIFIILLPTFIRWKFGNYAHSDFGYYETATYFRSDGIAIGCFFAFLVYRMKLNMRFPPISKTLTIIFFFGSILFNDFYQNSFAAYCFGYLLLNISLFFLIAFFYFSKDFAMAKYKFIPHVASMAYSIYLTHAVVINFMGSIYSKYHLGLYVIYPITVLAVYIIGFSFFKLVEQPTIAFRNYYFMPNSNSHVRFYRHLNFLRNSNLARLFKLK